ncbi:MAG: NAD(P)H-hydrate dehydratase [Xanthomonadales bacterium]|nr:NAD(P)H-hydrate dehydratase [Xanthomonadales bacterium]
MTRALYDVAQVRAFEAILATRHGIDARTLMERAGAAAARVLRVHWPQARRVLVAAGPGNNGGDGYVLARLLRAAGTEVTVLAPRPPGGALARAAAISLVEAGGTILDWAPGQPVPEADLVVDALFGVGLTRAPEGPLAALIEVLAERPGPVFALDLPSGLNGDTGAVAGAVLPATRTLALLADKPGLHTGRGLVLAGVVQVDDLDCSGLHAGDTACRLLEAGDLAQLVPSRRRDAHKGDCGHLLVVGGDTGMSGAVRLAGLGALRAGAGRVTIATRAEHLPVVGADRPELMVHAVESVAALRALLERCDGVVAGPGMGQGPWARTLLPVLLACGRPLLLDADALNLVADRGLAVPPGSVLTPHPGEAARLLAVGVSRIQADRPGAARALANRHESVVVLKGAGTVIDDGSSRHLCSAGNPGMATAGAGDVLAGVIGALQGQGLTANDAACAGVLAHALAGDRAALAGQRGLLAADIAHALPAVLPA